MRRALLRPAAVGVLGVSAGLGCLQALGDPFSIGTGAGGGTGATGGGGAKSTESTGTSTEKVGASSSAAGPGSTSGPGGSTTTGPPCAPPGQLVGGRCLVTLAGGQDSPSSIVLNVGVVFWTNDVAGGSVMSVPSGGGATEVVAANETKPYGITSNDYSLVVWTTGDDAVNEDYTPDGGKVYPVVSGLPVPQRIVIAGGTAYWTESGAAPLVNGLVVGRGISGSSTGPKDAGTQDSFGDIILATNQENPTGIASSGDTVFWIETDPGRVSSWEEGVTIVLSNGEKQPVDVAADTKNAYWLNAGDGTVRQTAHGGVGVPTTIATTLGPARIAVDGTSVYWTEAGGAAGGAVRKVPIGGGTVTTIADMQDGPQGIVVDATSVYWVNGGGGTVMKATPK